MKITKAAVIGVGNIGKHHARIYGELSDVDLVGICDLDEKVGNDIADMNATDYFDNYAKLIKEKTPDVVSICVPTSLHFKIALDCITQGINVLVEKPITSTIEEAEVLIAAAKKHNVTLMVGHIERFNPAVRKLKTMIEEGKLGKISSIVARRVGGFPPQIKDADVSIDLAIHDIDIVNYLLNKLPESVVVNKHKNHIKSRADSVDIMMTYDFATAFIQANWITPVKIRKLNITGTKAYVELDYILQSIDFYKCKYKKLKEKTKDFSDYILIFSQSDKQEISLDKSEPLKDELKHFLKLVSSKLEHDPTHALDALRIASNN